MLHIAATRPPSSLCITTSTAEPLTHLPYYLAKRESTRQMNHCTGPNQRGWRFIRSSCSRATNLRALTVECHHPYSESFIRDVTLSCTPNELCFETGDRMYGSRAYCIETEHFALIPDSGHQRIVRIVDLDINSDEPFAADAMLVDQYRRQGLAGASIFELAALRGPRSPMRVQPAALPIDSVSCVGQYISEYPS